MTGIHGPSVTKPVPRPRSRKSATVSASHTRLSSPALCAIAHWGGGSGIPEAAAIESIGRGVLNAPAFAGQDGLGMANQKIRTKPQPRSACRPLKVRRLGSRTPAR
jgi:hypothetical protein